MKQETLARELGIAQQNVSKMEKKKDISLDKLEAAAKVLGITVDAIEKFNEKNVLNNNIALEQNSGQVNNVHPIKEVIDYFKDEILKRDKMIEGLTSELEEYRKAKKKPAKQSASGSAKSLHLVEGQTTKQAAH